MSIIEKALAKHTKPGDSATGELSEQENLDSPAVTGSETQTLDIDQALLSENELFITEQSRSILHNEFRFVKRRILQTAFGPQGEELEHPNLIMISSANKNEGKTFTALNLALSIALEQDKTVLLIDADVLKPSICNQLHVKADVGLVDYLLGETTDLQSILYNTNIPHLRIMPSGTKHHLTNELLASEKMEELSRELACRYPDRIILFDAPPLLGINETQALTSIVGQQLIVVEENKTKVSDLESAISLLNKDRAIGLVLNKANQRQNGYFGNGYQYTDGY